MKKEWRARLLRLTVTAVVLGVLAWRLDLKQSAVLLGRVQAGPVLMAIGLLAGSHAMVALVWRFLLERTGILLKVERSIRLYFAGLFLNNFFLGSLGGDSYRIWEARSTSGAGRLALAATLVERIVGVVALLALGLVASLAAASSLPASFAAMLIGLTGAGTVAGLAVLFLPDLVERLAGPLLRRLPEGLVERAHGVLVGMRRAGDAKTVGASLLVLLAAQGMRIWTHWWCAAALGIEVGAGHLFVAIPLVAVAAGLPISVGGLGIREGTGVVLLAPLGITHPEAVAMEFLAYLVGVGTSLLGGLAFLTGLQAPPRKDADLAQPGDSTRMGS